MHAQEKKRSPRAQLWVILAITFFGFFGLSMPYLIFPTLFLNPAYTILPEYWSEASRGLFLGITLAAYPLGQFLGSPILGALSDDYGRRKLMSLSLIIAAFGSLLTALSLSWELLWLLIASRFLSGLMEGNLAIARAMAADIKALDKHDTFGKVNAAAGIAYLVGPMAGGILSDKSIYAGFALSTPFYVICFLFITLSAISYIAINERSQSMIEPGRTFWERINFIARLKRLFTHRRLKSSLIAVTLVTLAVDIFFEFGPVYLTATFLWGPAVLSIYNAALSLTLSIGCGYLAAHLAKRFPDQQLLTWFLSALTLGLVAVTLVDQPLVMLLLFAAIGFAIAIPVTNLTVQVSDAASDTIQGEVMGVQTSLRVLGDAIICLTGGILFALSPALVLIVAACIAALSLVYYHLYLHPLAVD